MGTNFGNLIASTAWAMYLLLPIRSGWLIWKKGIGHISSIRHISDDATTKYVDAFKAMGVDLEEGDWPVIVKKFHLKTIQRQVANINASKKMRERVARVLYEPPPLGHIIIM